MEQHLGFLVDIAGSQMLADAAGLSWVHAFRPGKFTHPAYGEIDITTERLARMAANIQQKVRGIDPDIDYAHKQDPSLGEKAAGWVRDAKLQSDGLWLGVSWTDAARTAIQAGEWRYFSPEFKDVWENPQTKTTYQDVLFGGGLTNRPFLKDLVPVNLSEMFSEGPPKGGASLDPKKIRQLVKLKEDATDEEVEEALKKMGEPPVKDPPAPTLTFTEEDLKKNPVLKQMADALTLATTQMAEQGKKIVELETSRRMSEFNLKLSEMEQGGKYAIPPAIKDKVRKLAQSPPTDAMQLSEKMLEVFTDLSKTGLIQLGERGGKRPEEDDPGNKSGTSGERFNNMVLKKMKDEKMGYADALEQVSADEPQLFEEYRRESFSVPLDQRGR